MPPYYLVLHVGDQQFHRHSKLNNPIALSKTLHCVILCVDKVKYQILSEMQMSVFSLVWRRGVMGTKSEQIQV